jgi:GntR family transcriptional regulator/MocR family aminotransferase
MARRTAGGAVLLLPLPEIPDEPLHRRLYRALRDAIFDGRLPAGSRLPSTRTLAGELDLSRNTVLTAFDQLAAEGYVGGRAGAGTRVMDGFVPPRPQAPDRRTRKPRLSRAARRLRGLTAPLSLLGPHARAFRPGLAALDLFPTATWARLSSRWWRRHGTEVDDDTAGLPALREAVAGYLRASRGVTCEAGQVIIVGGSQQALDLVTRVLVDEGTEAWVEDPGYMGARWALAAAGARLVRVPVDGEGLRVDEGRRRAPRPRVIHVTPSHQFPLGATMSASRRVALLDAARRAEAWIVEDDYDGEFRYSGRPVAALQTLDGAERVIYVGTFSKVLTSALRLAYVIAPHALVDALLAARRAADLHPPAPTQGALAEFLAGGHFERHLRAMREVYRERQAVLVEEAGRRLGGLLDIAPTDTGLHVVGWLGRGVGDVRAQALAARRGVDALALSRFGRVSGGRGGLVLGYAACAPSEIRAGVVELARALEPVGGAR